DQQDRCGAMLVSWHAWLRRRWRSGLRCERQVNLERRPAADLAVQHNVAPVLLDDPENRAQAQAGAFALLLGGEERLKDAALRGRIHSTSSVADREHEVGAGHDSGLAEQGFVNVDAGCFNSELATA